MATITTTHVIDDIDGSRDATTIRFSIGRTYYEVDLAEDNTEKLYEALQPFIKKARKASAGGRGLTPRAEHQKVRDWARNQGLEVNDRGRLPNQLIKQYLDAH